jgi:hypothetical protein
VTTLLFVTLDHIECFKCHVVFGLTADHNRQLRERGDTFYCPNGHDQHYIITEAQRLRREVDAMQREIEGRDQRLASMQDDLRCETLSHRATKGQLTKARKRAAHGVCPVQQCGRTFANVQRHLDQQHPEWVTEHAHEEAAK